MSAMGRPAVDASRGDSRLDARFAKGIAAILLLGLTFLLNGLAKLFEFHSVRIGWYVANLIDRADARFILNAEVNHNARHHLPLIGRITNHLVLPHWTPFSWGLTVVELAAGIMLTLGLWSRLGAVIALVPTVFLFFVYFANDRWVPEQPLELVPLIVLALVLPGGYGASTAGSNVRLGLRREAPCLVGTS